MHRLYQQLKRGNITLAYALTHTHHLPYTRTPYSRPTRTCGKDGMHINTLSMKGERKSNKNKCSIRFVDTLEIIFELF